MRYRFSQPGTVDLAAFDEMLRGYLLEEEKAGSPVRLTVRTLEFYRSLAFAYTIGSLFGTLVFAEAESPVGGQPIGFALAGESGMPPALDLAHGRTAQVWITWVDPAHRQGGVGLGMLAFGEPRLLELGFELASMSFREGNELGEKLGRSFGAFPVERFYHYRLGGTDHGRRIQTGEPAAADAGDV